MPLTVEITSSDTEGEVAPATFEFDADVTGGTEPYTYSWDFDGEGSGESDEQTVSHTFEEAGSYNVGLTITDSEGRVGLTTWKSLSKKHQRRKKKIIITQAQMTQLT